MEYGKAGDKLFKIVCLVWEKVYIGIEPEIDDATKLLNIRNKMKTKNPKKGFWDLFSFLVQDLIPLSVRNPSKEIKETLSLLEMIDDGKKVASAKRDLKSLRRKLFLSARPNK